MDKNKNMFMFTLNNDKVQQCVSDKILSNYVKVLQKENCCLVDKYEVLIEASREKDEIINMLLEERETLREENNRCKDTIKEIQVSAGRTVRLANKSKK